MANEGKKTSAIESSDKRDAAQKSMGFIGLSALAHIGVLITVLLAPSFKSPSGVPTGVQAGEELTYAGTTVADPAAPGTEASSAPTEVLLADANDESAVVEAKPKAARKQVSAPKPAPAETVKIETDPKSEIAIQQALEETRAKDVAQELPAELDPPQMDEPAEEAAAAPAPVEATTPAQDETSAPVVAAAPAEEPASPTEQKQEEVKPVATEDASAALPTAAIAASAPSAPAPSSSSESGTSTSASSLKESGAGRSQLTAPGATGAGASGATGAGASGASGGGGAKGTFGVPSGAEIRDARELSALPGNPKPTYPLQDKLAGNQGTTVLVGLVKADGGITNVAVEQSSGSKLMDQAAAQAFAKWKFKPGQSGYVRSPFQFQLVGSAKEVPARLRTQ